MKNKILCTLFFVLTLALAVLSLFIGKYHFSFDELAKLDAMQWQIFYTLRIGRTITALAGGFALGLCGFVFQIVFKNALASPSIIGVSSGASAGAAAGILFFGGTLAVTFCSFVGSLCAVALVLWFSYFDKNSRKSSIVLAGIAVHALAQTILMSLKLLADPESHLASIEYWMMGSLSNVSIDRLWWSVVVMTVTSIVLFALHRQLILLSSDEDEARSLGVSVQGVRLVVLFLATLCVSSVISMTGLISFIGLVAPHIARKLIKNNKLSTMFMAGVIGSFLLIASDILARSLAKSELPISIFTSILGVPFLIWLTLHQERLR